MLFRVFCHYPCPREYNRVQHDPLAGCKPFGMCYLLQSSELVLSTRRLRQEKKPIEAAIGPSRLVRGSCPPFGVRQASVCASALVPGLRIALSTIITD